LFRASTHGRNAIRYACTLQPAKIAAAGKLFNAPDIEEGKKRVYRKVDFYSAATGSIALALQAESERNKEENDILEWIWPESKPYKVPMRSCDLVHGAGEWFLQSLEYTNWSGHGPSTLICPGQGNFSHYCNG
jgi:hypothetical protein